MSGACWAADARASDADFVGARTYDDPEEWTDGDVLQISFRRDGFTSNPFLYRNVATVAYPTTTWTYTFPSPLDGPFVTKTEDEPADPIAQDNSKAAIFLYLEKADDPEINSKNLLGDTDFQLSCSPGMMMPGATAATATGCLDCPCDNESCAEPLECMGNKCMLVSQTDADGTCVDGTAQCACREYAGGTKGCLSLSLTCQNDICVADGASQTVSSDGSEPEATASDPSATADFGSPTGAAAITTISVALVLSAIAVVLH